MAKPPCASNPPLVGPTRPARKKRRKFPLLFITFWTVFCLGSPFISESIKTYFPPPPCPFASLFLPPLFAPSHHPYFPLLLCRQFFNGWLAFRLPFTRLFVVLWWFYLGGARIERRLRDLSGSTDKNNSRTPTHIYQHHQQGRPDWRRGRLVRRSLDPQSLSITRESRDSTYWLGRLIHHRPMERMDAIHLHLLFNWERFFFFRKKKKRKRNSKRVVCVVKDR